MAVRERRQRVRRAICKWWTQLLTNNRCWVHNTHSKSQLNILMYSRDQSLVHWLNFNGAPGFINFLLSCYFLITTLERFLDPTLLLLLIFCFFYYLSKLLTFPFVASTTTSQRDSCVRQGNFYCEFSRECIAMWRRCDGYAYCYYGEDESGCGGTTSTQGSGTNFATDLWPPLAAGA